MPESTRYRALVGVTWMSNATQIARLKKGEAIPHAEREWGRAERGEEIPASVPAAAIRSMLEQGTIVPAEDFDAIATAALPDEDLRATVARLAATAGGEE